MLQLLFLNSACLSPGWARIRMVSTRAADEEGPPQLAASFIFAPLSAGLGRSLSPPERMGLLLIRRELGRLAATVHCFKLVYVFLGPL
jgi:hypothetical protein